MLNKKLVLGGLAGATLLVGALVMLPASAQASMVKGTCHNCHTMHNSENGNSDVTGIGPQDYLLKYNGCVGCHATATNNDTSGRDSASPFAPQVNDTSTNSLAGGYFNTAGNANAAHSVADLTFTSPQDLGTPPGGTQDFTGSLDCTDCHGAVKGGHHSTVKTADTRNGTSAAGDSYRFLRANTDNAGNADGNYVSTAGASAGNYACNGTANTVYQASGGTGLNAFCADCHSLFHVSATTGSGPFQRHPVDVSTDTYGTEKYQGTNLNIPVGDAGTANEVMCISCHRPHGSAYVDLLRFDYTTVLAGDTTADTGCEVCHGVK